jgi:hypothetical protein
LKYGRRSHVRRVALGGLGLATLCALAIANSCSSADGPLPQAPEKESTPPRGSTAEAVEPTTDPRPECGPAMCEPGQVCCNRSCGICTPPGGLCTQQLCNADVLPQKSCGADADCRLYSDYCEGCACRALTVAEPDPSCNQEPVQCLVDPCENHEPACIENRCGFKSDAEQTIER